MSNTSLDVFDRTAANASTAAIARRRGARPDRNSGRRWACNGGEHARCGESAQKATAGAHCRRRTYRLAGYLRVLKSEADEVICAMTPEPFHAVGLWYGDFSQTNDEEIQELLARAAAPKQPDERMEARL